MKFKTFLSFIAASGAVLSLFAGCGGGNEAGLAEGTVLMDLKTDYRINPEGIDSASPSLSWRAESNERGLSQSAFRILVANDLQLLASGSGDMWDSGMVKSGLSAGARYAGKPLISSRKYYWKVKTRDSRGRESRWSDPAFFSTGLFSRDDWDAKWIGAPDGGCGTALPVLRREFSAGNGVKSARLFSTACGLYEISINGVRAGTGALSPGWTDYRKRFQYQVCDVTGLVKSGGNAIGAVLAPGWYAGEIGMTAGTCIYGDELLLLARLEIEYEDGTFETVVSDGKWKSFTDGPVLSSSLFLGETHDARKNLSGWDEAGFDDSAWSDAIWYSPGEEELSAQPDEPVRVVDELKPVSVWESSTKPGVYIFDFGVNIAGRVTLRAQGSPGQTVTIRHAEVLQPAAGRVPLDAGGDDIYTANLRTAAATDVYVMKGGGVEEFTPRFTYHGFRYAEVTGLSGTPDGSELTAQVLSSGIERIGSMRTSNEKLNILHENIVRTQRSNFVSVPTDCPQRDERNGWTGDIAAFVQAAVWNLDCAGFLGLKWLKDLRDGQNSDGQVPNVAPDSIFPESTHHSTQKWGRAAWADAMIIVPYTLWKFYGDTRIIEENFEAMRAYIDFVKSAATDYLVDDDYWAWGDWLSLDETGQRFIDSAYHAYTVRLFAGMAAAVGMEDVSSENTAYSLNASEAICEKYIASDGTVDSGSQTAYALALGMGLIADEHLRQLAAARLDEAVRLNGNRLTTGFQGTAFVLDALSSNGYTDTAYSLLLQEECPSWLYQVNSGATSVWERWDSVKPDGSYQSAAMNSFNHYALGSVGNWMFRNIAGLYPAEPGFKSFYAAPMPGGDIKSAESSYRCPCGEIKCSWQSGPERFRMELSVPYNTTAEVRLPCGEGDTILEGGVPAEGADGVSRFKREDNAALFEAGSGDYVFEVIYK